MNLFRKEKARFIFSIDANSDLCRAVLKDINFRDTPVNRYIMLQYGVYSSMA